MLNSGVAPPWSTCKHLFLLTKLSQNNSFIGQNKILNFFLRQWQSWESDDQNWFKPIGTAPVHVDEAFRWTWDCHQEGGNGSRQAPNNICSLSTRKAPLRVQTLELNWPSSDPGLCCFLAVYPQAGDFAFLCKVFGDSLGNRTNDLLCYQDDTLTYVQYANNINMEETCPQLMSDSSNCY